MLGFGLIFMLISFGLSILMLVSSWRLFEKADEPGWKILVPIYNAYIVAKIGTGKGWLIFLPFIGGVISGFSGEGTIALLIMLVVSAIMLYVQFSFIRRFANTGMAVASMFVPFIILNLLRLLKVYL